MGKHLTRMKTLSKAITVVATMHYTSWAWNPHNHFESLTSGWLTITFVVMGVVGLAILTELKNTNNQ